MPNSSSPSSHYSNHADQRETALPSPERFKELSDALSAAFERHSNEVPRHVISFEQVSVDELADGFMKYPIMVKSILAAVNVAQRAVKRDLGFDLDTYATKIKPDKAKALAAYIKPLLPSELAFDAILMLDHFFWVDKEMRAGKGRWESRLLDLLNKHSTRAFKKRKFRHEGGAFEIDAACPVTGEIRIGVDVKRFESPRDFHKRGDEITQKVSHLRDVLPDARFYAVLYYPFPSRHGEVLQRYDGQGIDAILFAGESEESLLLAVKRILSDNGLLQPTEE